jgi:ApaG protein
MNTIQQITVNVIPQYLSEQSDPDANQYVFAYTVNLKNTGNVPAKLLSRHWVITDADGETREVRGPGVVGEHPHLQPGEQYEYTSGAILTTPVGSMMGSYQMQDDNGGLFDAQIPAFTLSAEVVFH